MLLIQWGSVGTVKNSVSSCSTQGYNGKPSIPRQPPFPAEWWWILQWWAHWNQPLKQHTLLPQGFYQQAATNSSVNLWDTKCKYQVWWLDQKVQLLCPMRQAKREQSQPSSSPRHWDTFCHSRERTASERFLQQTQLITQENTIAWHRVFWPRFLPGLIFGHGFLQMVQGRVRFVGRAMAHNRITIFKLFLLQPDAGCPFFPDGQPLLPKAWCAGKLNPTCSILFSAGVGSEVRTQCSKPEGH